MKGLHPEFLLGKKGSHFEAIVNSLAALGEDTSDLYDKLTYSEKQKLIQEVKHLERGKELTFFTGTEKELDADAMKIRNIIEIQKASKEGRFRVYSVGKNFFEAVSRLDRDVPFEYIGADDDVVFIKTPTIVMNGVTYDGCYVRSMSHGVMLMPTPRDTYTLQGCRVVLVFSPQGKFNPLADTEFNTKAVEFKYESETETQVFADFVTHDHEGFTDWMNGVVNTAVYINSQDPEIEELRPLRLYDRKQLSGMESSKREHLCTFPVRLVNWAFHRRVYSVDSTMVSGHFRRQPCGVGRTGIKLVWIDEHVRTYEQEVALG